MMQDLVLCNVVAIKRVLECVVRGPLAFKVLFCCHHLVEEASNYSNKRKHFSKFTVCIIFLNKDIQRNVCGDPKVADQES